MPNLTYRKRGHKDAGKENPPVTSKSSKHVIALKKHVPQSTANKNSTLKTKNIPEVDDAEDVDDSEPELVKDISNQTYSLHKSVCKGVALTRDCFLYKARSAF